MNTTASPNFELPTAIRRIDGRNQVIAVLPNGEEIDVTRDVRGRRREPQATATTSATSYWPYRRYYSVRDARGRFTRRRIRTDLEIRIEGTFVATLGDATAHDHTCPTLAHRHDVQATGADAHGWLCSVCVDVDLVPLLDATMVPATAGTATCCVCAEELPLRKFPTAKVRGGRFVRDARRCRGCRDADRAAMRDDVDSEAEAF